MSSPSPCWFSNATESDIHQILLEAKTRWLRPSEICEILRNYIRFNITPDPPYKPPGGSLFLFDRKALRYFRKDGHDWRKKKDGKTVREAHEKLKSGSVDVLHCYYAHGEENENFQRRSYWLLDGELEHIVLVHYRDLNEGCSTIISQQLNLDLTSPGVPTSLEICSTPLNSSAFVNRSAYTSSTTSSVECNTQTSLEFEDGDSCDDFCGSARANTMTGSAFQVQSFPGNNMTEDNVSVHTGSNSHPYGGFVVNAGGLKTSVELFSSNQIISHNCMLSRGKNLHRASGAAVPFGGGQFSCNTAPSRWSEVLRCNQNHNEIKEQSIFFQHSSATDALKNKFTDPIPENCEKAKFKTDGGYQVPPVPYFRPCNEVGGTQFQIQEENATCADQSIDDGRTLNDTVHAYEMSHPNHSYGAPDIDKPLERKTDVSGALKITLRRGICDDILGEFKKLDSFGRWINKEIVKDSNVSLIASDCKYRSAISIPSDEKELSSLTRHMRLDIDSLTPLSQEQLFSIIDFSPDWTYSEGGAKVLISGIFVGRMLPNGIGWCCMFGEVEVSAELLATNTMRCHAPPHSPGRVPFYVTCSNRLACSEIREFEYRENPFNDKFSSSQNDELEDELRLQVRFAKLLYTVPGNIGCSAENCYKCSMKNRLFHMLIDETEWDNIEKFKAYHKHRNHRDALLVKLLKERLYEWLVHNAHENDKGPNVLDNQGQGIIHLAAALGYEWAMRPIIASGVSPSFRDSHGRTALHWAAYYGSEETVTTLMKLGASPGAVEDPTSKFCEGQTAADLASSRGHKGIAGYLAEADLASHLFSISLTDKAIGGVSASLTSENFVEILEGKELTSVEEGHTSLRALAAVRNSAQAAACIQAVFRVQSFRQRELKKYPEKSEIAKAVLLSSLMSNIRKMSHFNSTSHTTAIKIQQKYRGWKGHKEFLKIRDRIVKIQAHARGHQVRKQYKRVVWSVSIVEKVMLRWRHKGSGFRGLLADKMTIGPEQEEERTDEYEFLRFGRKQKVAGIEKALSRVKSMARYPEARDQYMRLVMCANTPV